MDFNQNNLNKSLSPYLRHHSDNPIFWQEWNQLTLDYARQSNKLIFVSSGYSTCHWCHVMAKNTFETEEVANQLNNDFVSIKLDREERSDIDMFLMSFMTEHYGQGGWPLNVFLTPDLKPFFAFTYANAENFILILNKVREFYDTNIDELKHYSIFTPALKYQSEKLVERISEFFDNEFKGFSTSMKFPAHSTTLFLLHYFQIKNDKNAAKMAFQTLEKMATSGLYDPLAGGFFRYCVDREWTIPHFEKMMYDQIFHIINYSLAYSISGNNNFRQIVLKTLEYIETQSNEEGFYYTALDADTQGVEGKTYLWTIDEINKSGIDIDTFNKNFDTVKYEGSLHLIKKTFDEIPLIENILLQERNKKPQPFCDKKIITVNNCLLGVAFYYAGNALKDNQLLIKAFNIYDKYKSDWLNNNKMHNLEFEGETKETELLETYASFLLLTTYFEQDKELLKKLRQKIMTFNIDGQWYNSINSELGNIPAQNFDHPIPSAASLVKMALVRAAILLDEQIEDNEYLSPYNSDFYNLAVFANRYFTIIHTKKLLDFVPAYVIQIKSDIYQLCQNQTCIKFNNQKELEDDLFPTD